MLAIMDGTFLSLVSCSTKSEVFLLCRQPMNTCRGCTQIKKNRYDILTKRDVSEVFTWIKIIGNGKCHQTAEQRTSGVANAREVQGGDATA